MNVSVVVVVGSLVFATALRAEDATLKMRFVLDGDPPAVKQINLPGVVAVAGAPIIDETLLVDRESRGIRNVVVFLGTSRGRTRLDLPPHESEKRRITIANARFDPHILIARAGDSLEFIHQGPHAHSLDIAFFENRPPQIKSPLGQSVVIRLAQAERGPVPIDCNIHPWMKAYLVVLDHPFGAISDEKGAISIDGLPANTDLEFSVFHEAARIEHVRIDDTPTDWSRSRFKHRLSPGLNDFGEILVPGDAFRY